MRRILTTRLALPLLAALCVGSPFASPSPRPALAAPVERPHIVAELASEHETIRPGETFTAALRLAAEDGWHTYWENPGDSGRAPRIRWKLPAGFEAGPLEFPAPQRFVKPPYVTYGYAGEVLLPVEIHAPSDLAAGTRATLTGEADWLVCENDFCVPGNAELELTIDVTDDAPLPDSRWVDAFAATRTRLPRPLPGWTVTAAASDRGYLLRLTAPEGADPLLSDLELFARKRNIVDGLVEQHFTRTDGGIELVVARHPKAEQVARLEAVLAADQPLDFEATTTAASIDVPVAAASDAEAAHIAAGLDAGAAPAAGAGAGNGAAARAGAGAADPAPAGASPASRTAPAAAAGPQAHAASLTIGVAMVFALLGGLILNLMPCVFPVLSLKILGFVQAAHHDAASIRRHGLVFGAGVLVSFWFLAGTLIALRAAGNELGWGFQLQSPTFVAGLALGLFVLALNLLGVFEMGGSLQTVAGRMDGHAGYRGSFASGVLATVLATPCTAPFMGTALGWALAQPAASSLAVFTALGAGMAAPYVVLSFAPRLLSRLPRPGAWMETFKQLMAFPLLATVVWLVWVLGQQTGNSGVASLLTALLSAGLAAWIFGRRAATGAGRLHALGTVSTVAAAAVSVMLVLAAAEPSSEPTAAGASEAATDSYGIRWIPYDAGVLADLREQGRRVFVDFTAAWCLTCKVNERITFGDADVRERLRELDVVTMKADWTDGDPAITRALESFGRSGVPLYVLYDGKAQPVVLPQVLGAGVFLEALAELEPATERLALRR